MSVPPGGNPEANPKLAFSPIHEVVFECRLDIGKNYSLFLPRLCHHVSTSYPALHTLPPAAFPDDKFGLGPTAHHRFSSSDGKRLIQASPRLIAVNFFSPYPGWETFKTEIIRIKTIVWSLLAEQRVQRFGLRYVNHLRVQSAQATLTDVLSAPGVNLGLGGNPIDAQLRSTLRFEDGLCMNVTLRSPVTDPETGNYVLLDLDCFQEDPSQDCTEWLEVAHQRLYSTFKKLLSDTVYQRFSSGIETAA